MSTIEHRARPLSAVAMALMTLLAAACGNDRASGGSTRTRDIEPFDVVSLDPGHGPGTRIDVVGARVSQDGTFAILVNGFSCGVPTELDVEESPDTVTVDAFAARYGHGACPADEVPWYIVAPIDHPLGDRRVQDASGEPVTVIDCREDPANARC